MKIKRCLSAFLCFALLFCGTVFAAGTGISINQPIVETGKVTVTGTAAVPEGTYVVLRVAKAGIAIDTAAPNEHIYIGETKTDKDGNYHFSFPIGANRGTFEMEATSNMLDEKAQTRFTFEPNGDSRIKSFQLNGKNCTVSGNRITGPEFTNVTGLIATFTLADGAAAYVNGVKQVSGTARNNFTNPVIYTVIADDGTESQYTVTASKADSGNGGGGSGSGSGNGGNFVSPGKNEPVSPDPVTSTFEDVMPSHWAYDAVEKMAAKDVVKGYEDGNFYPDNQITREEFVKVLVNFFDFVPSESEASFSDVDTSEWYAYYINTAVANGIIKGISEDQFGIGENISRQDMAVMLDRALSAKEMTLNEVNDKIDFEDSSSIAPYASNAVETLQKAGVINGYTDGSFRPYDNASRAEVCAMLSKID